MTDAIIVTYNSAPQLPACIASLRADRFGTIIVVDNASTDASVAVARAAGDDVVVLPQAENLGFGSAMNVGMTATSSPYVAMLNPDVEVRPGALAALSAVLDQHADVALVGPRIETPTGELYPSVRRFPALVTAIGHGILGFVNPDNRFSSSYRMLGWEHDHPALVDWVAGTFMLVRRDRFLAIGGFDERYFMYVEDVDLCWRLQQAGDRVAYEPAAGIVHEIGASTEQRALRMIVEHHRSLFRFADATTTGWRRGLLPLLAAGMAGRVVASWAQRAVRRRPPAAP